MRSRSPTAAPTSTLSGTIRAGAFQKDHGIRIDHLLVSPQAADRLQSVEIYRKARALEKPSDHVPVIGVFDD